MLDRRRVMERADGFWPAHLLSLGLTLSLVRFEKLIENKYNFQRHLSSEVGSSCLVVKRAQQEIRLRARVELSKSLGARQKNFPDIVESVPHCTHLKLS